MFIIRISYKYIVLDTKIGKNRARLVLLQIRSRMRPENGLIIYYTVGGGGPLERCVVL